MCSEYFMPDRVLLFMTLYYRNILHCPWNSRRACNPVQQSAVILTVLTKLSITNRPRMQNWNLRHVNNRFLNFLRRFIQFLKDLPHNSTFCKLWSQSSTEHLKKTKKCISEFDFVPISGLLYVFRFVKKSQINSLSYCTVLPRASGLFYCVLLNGVPKTFREMILRSFGKISTQWTSSLLHYPLFKILLYICSSGWTGEKRGLTVKIKFRV